jgi:hypothetical protein
MKKVIIFSLVLALAGGFNNKADAQIRFHLNFNVGSQPDWGPAGYNHAEYYYLPDIETYYYVPTRQYIYMQGGNWVFSYNLPPRYRNYDLYNGYKVVINEPKPYLRNDVYRSRYMGYRGHHGQSIWRDQRYRRDNDRDRDRDRRDNNDRDHRYDHDRGHH